jgi:hypothetical protein
MEGRPSVVGPRGAAAWTAPWGVAGNDIDGDHAADRLPLGHRAVTARERPAPNAEPRPRRGGTRSRETWARCAAILLRNRPPMRKKGPCRGPTPARGYAACGITTGGTLGENVDEDQGHRCLRRPSIRQTCGARPGSGPAQEDSVVDLRAPLLERQPGRTRTGAALGRSLSTGSVEGERGALGAAWLRGVAAPQAHYPVTGGSATNSGSGSERWSESRSRARPETACSRGRELWALRDPPLQAAARPAQISVCASKATGFRPWVCASKHTFSQEQAMQGQ